MSMQKIDKAVFIRTHVLVEAGQSAGVGHSERDVQPSAVEVENGTYMLWEARQ